MSLAGRIHLPGTQVTGKETVNLPLPATSDQECLLPEGTSCPPASGQPRDCYRPGPTLCSPPHPWGLRLAFGAPQPKGHLSSRGSESSCN